MPNLLGYKMGFVVQKRLGPEAQLGITLFLINIPIFGALALLCAGLELVVLRCLRIRVSSRSCADHPLLHPVGLLGASAGTANRRGRLYQADTLTAASHSKFAAQIHPKAAAAALDPLWTFAFDLS